MILEKRESTYVIENYYGLPIEVGFGYKPGHQDPRNFPLAEKIKMAGKKAVDNLPAVRRWNHNGWNGNQFNTSLCVGFGWANAIEDGPVTHKGPAPILSPETIYDYAQANDEWAGSETVAPYYEGTSVLAGAKACKHYGAILDYHFTHSFDEMLTALRLAKKDGGNCIVIGTDWDESMFTPDKNGFIKTDGNVAGGHCTKLDEVDMNKGYIGGDNSWGKTWGKNGRYRITFEEFKKLMKRPFGIEIATFTENINFYKKAA